MLDYALKQFRTLFEAKSLLCIMSTESVRPSFQLYKLLIEPAVNLLLKMRYKYKHGYLIFHISLVDGSMSHLVILFHFILI